MMDSDTQGSMPLCDWQRGFFHHWFLVLGRALLAAAAGTAGIAAGAGDTGEGSPKSRSVEGRSWGVDYTTSWLGDSADASKGRWVQNWIRGMEVTSDGTVFSNANWDEHNRNGGVYKDGEVLDRHHRSGAAGIALDDDYVYLNDEREIQGESHNVIERYHQSDYSPAPFEGRDDHVIDVGPQKESLWGLEHHQGKLFVSDIHRNRIRIYDAATGRHIRDFGDFLQTPERATHPLELAVEESGDLWVIQANLDHASRRREGLSITGAKLEYNAHGPGCHFVYTRVDGDATLTAKLAQVHHALGGSPLAGVLLRSGLDEQDEWVGVTLKNGKDSGMASGSRLDPSGGNMSYAPAWLKLERRGDRVVVYESGDGEEWIPVGRKTIELDDTALVGLAVQSRKGDVAGQADFTEIRLNGRRPRWEEWSEATIDTDKVTREGSHDKGVELVDTKVSRTIRQFDSDGEPTGRVIRDVPKCADIAIDPQGRLLVADDGPDQQIKIFDISDTPRLVDTLGTRGGVFAGTAGQWGPFKLNGPNAVGTDADGNVYVAAGGMSDPWDRIQWGMWSNWHTDLRAFSGTEAEGGELLWKLLGLMFVDSAVLDTQTGRDLYTMETHMTMDWSPTPQQSSYEPGQEWGEVYDQIHDGFQYPDDARHHVGGTAPIAVREIDGQKFLFLTKMQTKWVAIYRLNADGEVAAPAGFLTSGSMNWPQERPRPAERWIWTDADGDGGFNASEFQEGGFHSYRSSSGGWHVDEEGTLWHVSDDGLEKLPVRGLNDALAPVYRPDDLVREAQPSPFGFGARVKYLADQDVMYLSGYEAPEDWQWKSAGRVLARYDNWSEGNREPTWSRSLRLESEEWRHPADFSVAGDLIFVAYTDAPNRGSIRIFDTQTGEELGLMTPGPEVDRISGLIDMPHSIHAYRLDSGELIVLVEEDALGRILLYRDIRIHNDS